MRRYILALLVIMFLPFLPSCNSNGETSAGDETIVESPSQIRITNEQFDFGGMKISDPALHTFQQSIKANGYVAPSRSAWAKISAPILGKVKMINFTLGDFIKKGQLLFTIEGNEIIMLQQEYAESYTQLKSSQKSYERQKALSGENVTSEKEFLKAESEYKGILAKVEGLRAQLKLVNIDPYEVEQGHIISTVSVLAPIDGHVTHQELVLGQFIGTDEEALELIDIEKLQLNIHLFERDLNSIEPGQQVDFYDPNNPKEKHQAVLTQVGRSIDPDTKTIQCIAKIVSDKKEFVNGVFVEAEIITCGREALTIPSEAFVLEDDIYYTLVFIREENEVKYFKKIPVQIGVIQGDVGEVLEEDLKNILTKGGYNILSQ